MHSVSCVPVAPVARHRVIFCCLMPPIDDDPFADASRTAATSRPTSNAGRRTRKRGTLLLGSTCGVFAAAGAAAAWLSDSLLFAASGFVVCVALYVTLALRRTAGVRVGWSRGACFCVCVALCWPVAGLIAAT